MHVGEILKEDVVWDTVEEELLTQSFVRSIGLNLS